MVGHAFTDYTIPLPFVVLISPFIVVSIFLMIQIYTFSGNSYTPNLAGNTPIHYAACRGVLNIVVRLLNNGAEPDVANVQGFTPLHKACAFGQGAVVKKLIE